MAASVASLTEFPTGDVGNWVERRGLGVGQELQGDGQSWVSKIVSRLLCFAPLPIEAVYLIVYMLPSWSHGLLHVRRLFWSDVTT